MAKRLTVSQKEQISKSFINGESVISLYQKFNFSKLTIIRNLKNTLGEEKYKYFNKLNNSQANKNNFIPYDQKNDPTKLTKENFEIGKEKIPNLQIIAFKITNLFHKNIEKRFESLITQTAEERYVDLVKNHPKIINSISLKMIASYLGITDVALSRIRSRLAKKGNINRQNDL